MKIDRIVVKEHLNRRGLDATDREIDAALAIVDCGEIRRKLKVEAWDGKAPPADGVFAEYHGTVKVPYLVRDETGTIALFLPYQPVEKDALTNEALAEGNHYADMIAETKTIERVIQMILENRVGSDMNASTNRSV